MPLRLPRSLVEYLLLGPDDDRRLLQDSPILGDVWMAFANDPQNPQQLLITPQRERSAALVAASLYRNFARERPIPAPRAHRASISSLRGVVAAELDFEDVLRLVVPFTGWFERIDPRKEARDEAILAPQELQAFARRAASQWIDPGRHLEAPQRLSSVNRFIALAGLIVWAGRQPDRASDGGDGRRLIANAIGEDPRLGDTYRLVVDSLFSVKGRAMIHQVALNRPATMAIARSVPAIKGDAARGLFSVSCEKIAWAVLDSGIAGDHLAFEDSNGKSRVKKAFDFRNMQTIINLDNLRVFDPNGGDPAEQAAIMDVVIHDALLERPDKKWTRRALYKLALDRFEDRPPDWKMVTPFLEISPLTEVKSSDHGTHVAGILGARKPSPERAAERQISVNRLSEYVDGVCPDVQLYDFRVLGNSKKSTEYAIIGALEYIEYLNSRTSATVIHGANLSLSIRHDVKNYACGSTPVCAACEVLVESGVVVVVAAGNSGHHSFMTDKGAYEGYAAFSITDPGNAESVITVGSTHRTSPHTNGVSFFSSRGPTGDGRAKPDLVAPGEKIYAPVRRHWDESDGTSMAAPHVSGAAAMLMARYPELIGRPRRIKEILCKSATDLGRERSFQGHGMLDVLRAFQSI